MKKKILTISLLAFSMTILTGCMNAIPDLSEEDMDKVTTYMSMILLEHDVNYNSKLLTEEEKPVAVAVEIERQAELARIEEEERLLKELQEKENAPDDIEVEGGGSSSSQATASTLEDVVEIEGISITYAGSDIKDTYPDSGEAMAFTMSSAMGNKFIVSYFDVTNTTDTIVSLNFADAQLRGKFKGNGSNYTALTTLLFDDLMLHNDVLGAGETIRLVVVSEVPESAVANGVDGFTLNLRSAINKKSVNITL